MILLLRRPYSWLPFLWFQRRLRQFRLIRRLFLPLQHHLILRRWFLPFPYQVFPFHAASGLFRLLRPEVVFPLRQFPLQDHLLPASTRLVRPSSQVRRKESSQARCRSLPREYRVPTGEGGKGEQWKS